MRPVIGITPIWDEFKESLWMLPGYVEGIREEGAVPVILPLTEDTGALDKCLDLCDGLLFTGGHDVDPSLYGEERIAECEAIAPVRDVLETYLLNGARERKMPVLGICRGIQFFNVAYGGTLYQDLPAQHPSGIKHSMEKPYDAVQHYVDIVKGSPLHKLLGLTRLGVNSRHHQAVKQTATGLLPMAYSTDGLVEALYDPEMPFCWAVQWHPEHSFQTDEHSRRLFRAFVNATSGKPL